MLDTTNDQRGCHAFNDLLGGLLAAFDVITGTLYDDALEEEKYRKRRKKKKPCPEDYPNTSDSSQTNEYVSFDRFIRMERRRRRLHKLEKIKPFEKKTENCTRSSTLSLLLADDFDSDESDIQNDSKSILDTPKTIEEDFFSMVRPQPGQLQISSIQPDVCLNDRREEFESTRLYPQNEESRSSIDINVAVNKSNPVKKMHRKRGKDAPSSDRATTVRQVSKAKIIQGSRVLVSKSEKEMDFRTPDAAVDENDTMVNSHLLSKGSPGDNEDAEHALEGGKRALEKQKLITKEQTATSLSLEVPKHIFIPHIYVENSHRHIPSVVQSRPHGSDLFDSIPTPPSSYDNHKELKTKSLERCEKKGNHVAADPEGKTANALTRNIKSNMKQVITAARSQKRQELRGKRQKNIEQRLNTLKSRSANMQSEVMSCLADLESMKGERGSKLQQGTLREPKYKATRRRLEKKFGSKAPVTLVEKISMPSSKTKKITRIII